MVGPCRKGVKRPVKKEFYLVFHKVSDQEQRCRFEMRNIENIQSTVHKQLTKYLEIDKVD